MREKGSTTLTTSYTKVIICAIYKSTHYVEKNSGPFVSASVICLVFPLSPSPSPMSFVYIISKKKKKSVLIIYLIDFYGKLQCVSILVIFDPSYFIMFHISFGIHFFFLVIKLLSVTPFKISLLRVTR